MNGGWRLRLGGWAAGALLLLAACGGKQVESVGDVPADGAGKGGAGGTDQVGVGGDEFSAGATVSWAGSGNMPLPPENFPPAQALSKLDLLLMVDNSRHMLEKQRLLMDAVAWLLAPPGGSTLSTDDIHVGVVTSSLGSHGAAGAKDVCVTPEDNDHAHLIATVRPGVTSFQDRGFLAWGPDPDASPSPGDLVDALEPMLQAVGERGCGYEASLEAWHRFLVDPVPPTEVSTDGGAIAWPQGIDDVVLAQRAQFLRPDSVLAIVMLSDENDCSIMDQGYGWLISRAAPMYRSTSACQTNPNDACCQSCGETSANAGCPQISADEACTSYAGAYLDANAGEDDLNLRCWDQKRRFGFELLYPISRYTDALARQYVVQDSTATPVINPIFAGGQRHPSQVILTGIIGVPWQDLADEASLGGPGLTYLSAAELTQQQRWPIMLGDPQASPPVLPRDPFMIETPIDRAMLSSVSAHPLLPSERLVPSDSTNPRANAFNGHENADPGSRNLQLACIFPLQQPKLCDQEALDADEGCQCFEADVDLFNSALCQPPAGGPAGITQYFDGAYPGLRHLQVLRSLGSSAVTASICPKVFDQASPDYGYRPAMTALAARLEQAFNP